MTIISRMVFKQIMKNSLFVLLTLVALFAFFDLIDKQRNYGTPGTHYISVAGAADLRLLRGNSAGFGDDNFLHHSLGCSHGIDRIGRFVCGETDYFSDAFLDGGCQDVLRAKHVGLHCFYREELAGGDLLQRRCMENVIDVVHGVLDTSDVAHIAYVEF